MPRLPSIADFASFPTTSSALTTCLWYLPDEKRPCSREPKDRRVETETLRTEILATRPQELNPEKLEEFASLCCCTNSKHRTKLLDSGLAKLIAKRWQQELLTGSHSTVSVSMRSPAPLPSQPSTTAYATVAPAGRVHGMTTRGSALSQSSQETAAAMDSQISTSVHADNPLFRPRKVNICHTVASKLLVPLSKPTATPGTIYLYTRTSSPGYVKIGYTRQGAAQRLRDWEKACGYKPHLMAAFDNVPYIRKVESLIHFQFADAWRVEAWCSRCLRSHEEWFEINVDRAIEVAKQWTEWMKKAEPYNVNGSLKATWYAEIQRLESEGRSVTAEALLGIHREMVAGQATTSNLLTPVRGERGHGMSRRNSTGGLSPRSPLRTPFRNSIGQIPALHNSPSSVSPRHVSNTDSDAQAEANRVDENLVRTFVGSVNFLGQVAAALEAASRASHPSASTSSMPFSSATADVVAGMDPSVGQLARRDTGPMVLATA